MGPFIRTKNDTDKIFKNLFIALIPIIIFSFYKNGIIPFVNNKTSAIGLFYPLIFILIGGLSSYLIEKIYCKILKKQSYGSIFPGIFISLVLPINTPIEILIFACFIGIIVGKMLYGGFGNNVFNPALIGCLFVLTAYSSIIVNNGGYLNSYELDAIARPTPLSNSVEGIGTYDTLVKPYGNLFAFFIGLIPGSVGETSSLLCLIALIYLGIKKVIKIEIPIFYITTVFILTYIIGLSNGLGLWYPLFQIFSGGLMFGAVFMATDPVTSPVTKLGSILYGVCLGILTVICRYLTSYPEGVLTSILIMNMLVFILDKIGTRDKNYMKKILISISALLIIAISIIFKINNSFTSIDNDFNIIEKNTRNNITTYVATQKGFKGNIKAEIKIENNKIIEYKILECNDDYLSIVEKNNYLEKLKNNPEIDTVSGATKTSTALKKLIINVMKDSDIYEK